MPPPPPITSVTGGLSAQEASDADPDFLYFLRHVRFDGDDYAVVIPSEDGASSPPLVVRYNQPLPDRNAGTPVSGTNCGGQRAPPSWEENPRATSDAAPSCVKRKAPDASPGDGGQVRSGSVPMEEDMPTPVSESAWYDSQLDVDKDYSFFLLHAREVEGEWVFKDGNCSITIGEAEEDDDIEEEEEEVVEEEEGEGEGKEEEEEEEEEEEDDEVDNPASGQSEEDGISTEENDNEEQAIPASVTEVKEEKVSKEDDDDDMGPGSDLLIVNELVYYETKKVEEVEKPLNAIWGTTDLDPLEKKEPSSSKGHLGMPLNTSELQGVIWPPHINERPNSVFKEKLIECLIKPFTQEDYDKYFAMATDRTPVLKERRTRSNKVAIYPWKHETGKSYFDSYPDLAEQFGLQSNNYPNGLALLRGLFFWLKNVTHEDQFKPWSGEFKKYRVVIE